MSLVAIKARRREEAARDEDRVAHQAMERSLGLIILVRICKKPNIAEYSTV